MDKLRLYLLLTASALAMGSHAQNTPTSQMEKLDRGLVAVKTTAGTYLSWRLLGTDDEERTRFTILRNGTTAVVRDTYLTNYTDKTAGTTYQVVTLVDGVAVDTSKAVKPWASNALTIPMQRPQGGTYPFRPYDGSTKTYGSFSDTPYTYSPNDCSVGDMDGDGEYELLVKWDPSNSQDNSQQCGKTGNVYIDCYKLDGTLMWRVDLGKNIRAGAHYTQFMVYDLDGDGQAELVCKTAPGSVDGQGNYVNQAATDATIKAASNTQEFRNQYGAITGGQEYLTVFRGTTGAAVHTVFYNPNRNQGYGGAADGSFNWGTPDNKNDAASYGNRGERYLAAVAYLDGPDKNPSVIYSRGYYGYAFIWAVDFDGQQLRQRWLSAHKSKTAYSLTTYDTEGKGTTQNFSGLKATGMTSGTGGEGSGTMFANGNHNLSIADVDGDGSDEIIWGSAALDNDGRLLYATGFGHGDAIHLAKHCPDREGLQVFQIHEEKGQYAWDLHDAATGEVLLKGGPSGVDNGRGICGQFDANVRGSIFWSSSDGTARSASTGEEVSTKHGTSNFRIFWDGDLQEEMLDGNKIDKWNGNGTNRLATLSGNSCNSTKSTPNLSADILGDWREEVILWDGNTNNLTLYTSTLNNNWRLPTLMHDHTYRMGVCWQNVAYNQPPHLGYYLPEAMLPAIVGGYELTVAAGQEINWQLKTRYANYISIAKKNVPAGLTRDEDLLEPIITLTGKLTEEGDYEIPVTLTGRNNQEVVVTVTIHVSGETGIESVAAQQQPKQVYDLQGRQRTELRRGLNIVREGNEVRKVIR